MHTSKMILCVLAITAVLAPHAYAHSCVTDPPARRAASGPYSEMCSAQKYELSSGNCNGGGGIGCRAAQLNVDQSVCGGPFQASSFNPKDLPWDGKKDYAAGAVIDLSVYYRVSHTGGTTPGWVEARLCTNGDSLTQGCFDEHKLTAVGGDGLRHTVTPSTPPWTTQTYSFKLPNGVSCDKCTLQYIWQTSSWDGNSGEQFQNCADISISGGSGSGSGGGVGGDSPTTPPFEAPIENPTQVPPTEAPSDPPAVEPPSQTPPEESAPEETPNSPETPETPENSETPPISPTNPSDADSIPSPEEIPPAEDEEVAGEADFDEESDPAPPAGPSGGTCDLTSICKAGGVQPAPCGCDAKCKSFVKCAGSTGYLKKCPSMLRFNPELKNCDWPGNVPCTC